MVVQIALASGNRHGRRQHFRDHFLGGRFPRASRYCYDIPAPFLSRPAGERLQRDQRIFDAKNFSRACDITIHDRGGRSLLERLRHIFVPVLIRSAEREKQVAWADGTRIDAPTGHDRVRIRFRLKPFRHATEWNVHRHLPASREEWEKWAARRGKWGQTALSTASSDVSRGFLAAGTEWSVP